MPSLQVIEVAAELAANAAETIHPERLAPVIDQAFGKGAGGVSQIGGAARNVETCAQASAKDEILTANKALVRHVGNLIPQATGGQLDWILGGSSASNLYADARQISILDPARLPQIAPIRTMELPDAARDAYRQMARRVGDVDAFVVNGGQNQFLRSAYVKSMNVGVPGDAVPALKTVGEYRSEPLIQPVLAEFTNPEIAAIDLGDRTVYTMGPGQQLGNKFRHVLRYYSPAEQQKMTGDFSHILDAASSMYSDSELLQIGRQAIQRNNLLYDGSVLAPWAKTDDVTKFVGYMRRVLESEDRNGQYLQGLNIDSRQALNAMRLFEKHASPADKQALADFINRQEAGATASTVSSGGPADTVKRTELLLRKLDKITPADDTAGATTVSQQLEQLHRSLSS
jgi:hypothetical protein